MNKKEKELMEATVSYCNNGDFTSWTCVQEHMEAHGYKRSTQGWRAMFRKETDPKFNKQRKRGTLLRDLKRRNAMNLPGQLVNLLKKKRSLDYLVYNLKKTKEEILAEVVELQLHGYSGITIWEENDEVFIQNVVKSEKYRFDEKDLSHLYDGNEITFAVVSDTHMGSKFEALTELHEFYDYIEDKGVKTVLHIGDISDGWYTNRPTSIKDVHSVGFTEQLDHIVEHYPEREGITTYFITGNHDYTHVRNGFANIGDILERLRKDMRYMGHNYGRITLAPGVDVSMIHPTDGSAATLSLKLQKVVDKNEKRKAPIMLMGHYHKSVGAKYKGSYAYLVPSFQHLTPFMEDNNLTSDVGGMIFTVKTDGENILSVITEYVDLGPNYR